MPIPTVPHERPRSVTLPRGIRLHVLPTDRFATTICRVALHRDLGPEATATSLLGSVLESATARHPSREALAHRLADLYGAGLSVGVEKLGDRQVLSATLDWPTAGLPGRGATLAEGLAFLREVLTEPRVEGDALAADIVATEARNLGRALAALRDDKGRYALRRCLEAACRGEPYALDVEGRLEDLAAATPTALRALHRRLLATAARRDLPRRRRRPGAGEGPRREAPAVGGPRAERREPSRPRPRSAARRRARAASSNATR